MFRSLLIVCLILSLSTGQAAAFGLPDEGTRKVLEETWSAQTIYQLENGIVALPESAINDYLSLVTPEYPSIKSAQLEVHADNHISLSLDTSKQGKVFLSGVITKLVQNPDESVLQVAVDKRKMLDKPIASWIFGHFSLGMLSRVFGNPLAGSSDKFSTSIQGNTLSVDFRPYIEQSPISTVSVMNTPLASMITIDSVSSEEGVLYLHTTFHGSQSLLAMVRRILSI